MKITGYMMALALATACFGVGCGDASGPQQQATPRQHHEASGGFSFDPPADWQMAPFPGSKYDIAFGPEENDFTANLNVVDERFPGTLDQYVEANLVTLAQVFDDLNIISQDEFLTEDGVAYVRVITESRQQGRMLRQTFFFIARGHDKFVVTGSALAENGQAYDDTFARAMATFRLH